MALFQRPQVATLYSRLAEPPRQLIALFGPRQTGKTTIVRQALRQIDLGSRYLAVDEPDSTEFRVPSATTEATFLAPQVRDAEWLARHWEEARRAAEQLGGFVLVFDEIQKVPQWSETIKGLWDADRARDCPLHVVILGSAPLLMQSGLSESLAGRFESIRVTHWSFDEMSSAFDFDLPRYLYFGGYPSAIPFVRDPDRWRDYILGALVEPNIERDLLAMTRVDKPALLKRLFELGAVYSGQILSYTKMLGQLQDAGNTTTLARYLDLLASAGLLAGLPKYAGRVHRVRASSPKLNVLNTALMTAGSGYSFTEAQADRSFWGRIVESAVGAHLFNTATSDICLHYWRDGSHEVDFVLQRGAQIVAIEVKSGVKRMALGGMEEFERSFSPPSFAARWRRRDAAQRVSHGARSLLVRGSMSIIVPRTCTEISAGNANQNREKEPRSLKGFQDVSAYVLLGDPGSGKTTAFEAECKALGEDASLITARDFLTFDLQSHPEWRDKTLFIDGLDETRVGANDARTPFDQIRGRLDELGKPRFRLSCREADWLGANDRKHIESVSSNSKVTVLRLNPLTDSDIADILNARPDIGDAQTFIALAKDRGVDGLLKNPQTLNMLADVVAQGKGWPDSRKKTFDMACGQMVREHNEEHQAAQESNTPPTPDQLLDAAGRLCAVQLISGAAGYTLRGQADEKYPALDQCDSGSLEMLRHALTTKLFEGSSNSRFIPVHRHIAEFLGARHLAQVIDREPLPARRIIALIAGEDGTVVTEMRGLSAWLAAHCEDARAALIERDSHRRRAIRRHPRVLHRREMCVAGISEPRGGPARFCISECRGL